MNIRVFSWNIWMGKYLPKIIRLLQSEKPDVIALQEVIQNPDGTNNTAEEIAKALGHHWVFAEVIPGWGEAVLSRYDIVTSAIHELSTNPRHIGLDAEIKINGTKLHVVSTHLTHTHQATSAHQEQEAGSLVRLVPKTRTVIMGDFNALPESNTIGIMRDALTLVDPENQPTWCVYPDGCPTCYPGAVKHRLDYLFTTPDLNVSNYRVLQSDGSDHLPLEAVITLG